MNRYYFLYRRVQYWVMWFGLDTIQIAFPLMSIKTWVYDTKINYLDDRLLEAQTARRKCEAHNESSN